MILEGVVTTLNADGSVNISPMGPEVEQTIDRLVLKPYRTSTTYQNLKRSGHGVFHVTDDVELIARAAVGRLDPLPRLEPCPAIDGQILADACRWYAFRVASLDDVQERTRIECEVVGSGRLRDFWGFNRAKHAVLEAAILATRLHLLPEEQVADEWRRLQSPIDKTGGDAERRAFEFLTQYVERARHAAGERADAAVGGRDG